MQSTMSVDPEGASHKFGTHEVSSQVHSITEDSCLQMGGMGSCIDGGRARCSSFREGPGLRSSPPSHCREQHMYFFSHRTEQTLGGKNSPSDWSHVGMI